MSLKSIRERLAALTKGPWRKSFISPGFWAIMGQWGDHGTLRPSIVAACMAETDATLLELASTDLAALLDVAEAARDYLASGPKPLDAATNQPVGLILALAKLAEMP